MNYMKFTISILIILIIVGIVYYHSFSMKKSNILLSETVKQFIPVENLPENIKFDGYASAPDMIVIPNEIKNRNPKIEVSGGIYNNGNLTIQIAKYYDTSILSQVVEIINKNLLEYNMTKKEIIINGVKSAIYSGKEGTVSIVIYNNYLIGGILNYGNETPLILLIGVSIDSIKKYRNL